MAFRWIHLSDFHFADTPDPYERNIVLEPLLAEITRRRKEEGFQPDAIFVTGDIAYSGKPAEYNAATSFFDNLLEAVGLDKTRLFAAPGNHDLDKNAGEGLLRTLNSEKESADYFAIGRPKYHFNKFQAFSEWFDGYFEGISSFPKDSTCQQPVIFRVDGLAIAILPINTALFSLPDKKDHNSLWIGRRNLDAIAKAMASENPDLTFALLHHPLDWLHDGECSQIKTALQKRADFILCGHLHKNEVDFVVNTHGGCLYLAAGACYQTRDYPNSALFCTADLNQGQLEVLPIHYVDDPEPKWTLDTSLFDPPDYVGRFPMLKQSSAKERGRVPAKSTDVRKGNSNTEDEQMVRPNSEAHFDVFLSHNGPLARCLAEHQQPPIDGLSGQHCPQTDEPYPADGTYQPSQKCDDIAMFNISPNFLPESDVDMGSERIHESSLFPSNFPQSSHTTYAPFQRCLLANTIRQEIHKLLTKPELEVLRLNLLADRTDCDAVALLLPEEKMLDCDYIEKAITAYHIAVEAVLDKLLNGNSNSNVGFLKTLLGWLILLSVNDVWMNVFKNKFEKWQTVEFIELPLEKELGAAVVIARWGKKNAEIKMDGRYAEVYGERQFRAEFFEEDLRRTDALTDLKRAIWKSVYKDFEPPRNGNDKTLANVLKIRYERGTPHYIILNSTQYQALTNRNRQIIVQLRNDLPYLGTVVIGTNTGNEAMILPESTLEALIFEFLNMLKTGK